MNVPDLRRLADMHDMRPSYLSLYMDLRKGIDEAFFRKRQKQMETALSHDKELSALFRQAVSQADGQLRGRSWSSEGVAIFTSPGMGYLEALELPGEVENLMVFDSSPYIKPLVRLQHEWDEYLVVVLDHIHARIFLVAHFEILEKDEVAEEILRHHRHGGMSQMRFQRLHDGFVDHYFKEVAEHLVKEVDRCRCQGRLRGIVLAGPKDAKVEFERYIPEELRKMVVRVITEPADAPDGTVVRAAQEAVTSSEAGNEKELMDKLRGGILRHGLAAYGFDEVQRATAGGSADMVLLQKGLSIRGWRCEHCRAFGMGGPPRCPACGEIPLQVDAVEELVELAMDKGTRVEFLAGEGGIAQLGGIGALLRY